MARSLAENRRTQTKAAIKRASGKARDQLRRLDGESRRQLKAAYERAQADIREAIDGHADQSGNLRLENLRGLQRQIEQRLDGLAGDRDQLLDESLGRGADLGAEPFAGALEASVLTQASESALRFVQEFVGEGGLQLSDRLWRLDRHAREVVGQAVESAVVQGSSASRAAREFLSRGEPVPADVERKASMANAGRVSRIAGDSLMHHAGGRAPYDNALRVFRTEINRAFGESYRASAFEHPEVVGTRFLLSPRHPRRDICDMHANVNRHGLGPGVYPKGKSPWPAHPNTLSFEEVVFEDEVEPDAEAGQQDRVEWLKKQPPEIQEAVLDSRAKRAALEKGMLTEGEIATPWRVLKQRYARRGVDVDKLRPAPVAAQARQHQGEPMARPPARDYVLERGKATGHEFAVVYDTKTGRELLRKTSGQPSAVYFSADEARAFRSPRNSLELMHNHPSSSSLSVADLNLSSLPGVNRVVAAGHDGGVYSAKAAVGGQELQSLAGLVQERVQRRIMPVFQAGTLSSQQANWVHAHMVNSALHGLKVIDYTVDEMGPGLAAALDTMGASWFDQALDDVVGALRGRR